MKKTPNTSGIRYPVCVQGPDSRGYEIADATGEKQVADGLTLPHAERIRLALNATRNMTDSELAKMASQAVAISIAARHRADEYYLQNGFSGNTASFWRKNCAGYTADLTEALVLTKEQAFAQHAMRSEDIPRRKAVVDSLAILSVDVESLNRATKEAQS